MGLFSGKTVTYVATQVSRVIEDAKLPDSIQAGVAQNLINDDDQMLEHVLDQFTNSVAMSAKRMHEYGKKTYTYGVPNSSLKTSAAGEAATIAAISALVGHPVTLAYYHFAPFNHMHFAWKTLVESYGYDSSTNQIGSLTASKGFPVFLYDMQVILNKAVSTSLAPGAMDQWGNSPSAGPRSSEPGDLQITALIGAMKPATPYTVNTSATQDSIRVTYTYQTLDADSKPIHNLGTFSILVPAYSLDAEYHQASYLNNGKLQYWTYQSGTGGQPAVDAAFNTVYAEGGEFFPITYFRFGKQPQNTDKTSQSYKTSKHMLRMLGMSFDDVTTAIHKNPDIGQIEQALMMMAVPANSTNEMDCRYNFDFFSAIADELAQSQTNDFSKYDDIRQITKSLGTKTVNTATIIQDKRFKYALSYSNVTRTYRAGKLGVIGFSTGGYHATNKYHYYQRQISDVVYAEVRVMDLRMTYYLDANFSTTGKENDPIILIPVNMDLVSHYSIPDKEVLFSRALQYIFNSKNEQHVAWYATGFFGKFVMVVAIAIAVFTYQPEIAAFVTALTTGAITTAMIQAAVLALLKYVLIQVALKIFVQAVGPKIALIVAITAALVAGYKLYEVGGHVKDAPWAQELLSISNNMVNTSAKQIKSDVQDILHEYTDFEQYVKTETKVLDDAKALLNSSLHLDPMIIYGETPPQFYQRTVHSGNIGTLGIDMIGNYVDISLTLPTLANTVGDSSNVV